MKTIWAAWPFWLKLTLAAAIVFLVSAAGTWWTNDQSSFPNWLAGISTAAALLAAIVAARHAAGAFKLETDREHRWTQQQIRSQAHRRMAGTREPRMDHGRRHRRARQRPH